MTLPKGFGSGGSGRCPECREYLNWDRYLKEDVCKNGDCSIGRGEKNTVQTLPMSKKQLRLVIWHVAIISFFLLSVYAGIESIGIGILIFGFILFFSALIGWVMFEPHMNIRYHDQYSVKEVFPWFYPLILLAKGYRFRDE